jgi:hypothetical protein
MGTCSKVVDDVLADQVVQVPLPGARTQITEAPLQDLAAGTGDGLHPSILGEENVAVALTTDAELRSA